MKIALFITSSALSFISFGQLTNTTGESTSEQSEMITHWNVPAKIHTVNGKTYEGIVRYKEYGDKDLFFNSTPSENEEFNLISSEDGYDTIQKIDITNKDVNSEDPNFTYVPLKLSDKAENFMLVQLLEDNKAYSEYKFFQSTKTSFKDEDKPAPKGSIVPGFYDFYVLNKRNNEYIRKKNVSRLKKNIKDFVDYCDEVTDKVENKDKGYKVSLLTRDWDILKKVILEASETCPK